MKSQFFISRRRPASYYANSRVILVHSGIKLVHRGGVVGSIIHNKDTSEYEVSVVNRQDKLFSAEFKSFHEADRYAWLSATSA